MRNIPYAMTKEVKARHRMPRPARMVFATVEALIQTGMKKGQRLVGIEVASPEMTVPLRPACSKMRTPARTWP